MKGIVTALLVIALVHYITLFIFVGYISDKVNGIEWNTRRYKGEHEKCQNTKDSQ